MRTTRRFRTYAPTCALAAALSLGSSCGGSDDGKGFGDLFGPGGLGQGGDGQGGDGDQDGSGGSGDNCEVKSVRTSRVTPDMLIVVDRSLSMKMNDVNRWDPSVAAVRSITQNLNNSIHFGLMAFPSTQANRRDNCTPGRVEVPVGPDTAQAISSALGSMEPNGYTPTALTLEAAHDELGSGGLEPDQFLAPKYVLLVTDGAPNCANGIAGTGDAQESEIRASVDAIEDMAADGIQTYVIGYDTQSDNALRDALDRMAQAGGTGDQAHHPVEDEQSLLAALSDIARKAVSCDFALNAVPEDEAKLEIKLDGQRVPRDPQNGWKLSEDRRRVILTGNACETLKSGDEHTVSVQEHCEPVDVF